MTLFTSKNYSPSASKSPAMELYLYFLLLLSTAELYHWLKASFNKKKKNQNPLQKIPTIIQVAGKILSEYMS